MSSATPNGASSDPSLTLAQARNKAMTMDPQLYDAYEAARQNLTPDGRPGY